MRHELVSFRQSFIIASNGSIWTLVAAAALFAPPSLHAFCFVPMSLPIFFVSCACNVLNRSARTNETQGGVSGLENAAARQTVARCVIILLPGTCRTLDLD